jgi:hypothetical protein
MQVRPAYWIVIALLPLVCGEEVPAEELPASAYRHVLTSIAEDRRSESIEITPTTAGLPAEVPWSIVKRTLHGGKQEGVELITLDNGKLQIDLVATRGLSVLEVRSGDLRLGWNSPVKEIVHPHWIDLSRRGGLGWLEGFNEFIVRCGLEYAGHPGRDQFTDNTGGRSEMELSLHGRIGNLPATEAIVAIDRDPPHRIRVRGSVHERQFYGPQLELVAEVSTLPGSNSFEVSDQVINHGAGPQEFEMIYHSNYGRPLLEAGARIGVPAKTVTPMNARAAEGLEQYATYLAPTEGFSEQVYLIEPYADPQHQTLALLQNAQGQRGASIRWSIDELPYFTLWKNTAPEAAGYVTGLEPGTNFPFNRMVERQAGRLGKLGARQARRFTLTYALHTTAAEVEQVRREIEAIQGNRETRLIAQPPGAEQPPVIQ